MKRLNVSRTRKNDRPTFAICCIFVQLLQCVIDRNLRARWELAAGKKIKMSLSLAVHYLNKQQYRITDVAVTINETQFDCK